MTEAASAASPPAIETLPRDLSPYRAGNTGIDYVHRFDSGKPGPHVLVSALTHGNEFCGMVAACHLLDAGVRPAIGTLTVSFNNVAAYERFDASRPFDSRQIDHNLNRIWSAAMLDGDEDSIELRRARELRPAVAAADHILDIHSTSQDVEAFWVYPAWPRNAAATLALSQPQVHLVMPQGLGSGTPLIQHGLHGTPGHHGVAAVVECGGHFLAATAQRAIAVTLEFLAHFGLVERRETSAAAAPPARRFELLKTHVVQHESFAFTRALKGFETFAAGELIATEADQELRAPCDDCTVFMPTRRAIVGREGVYLTRPIGASG